MCLTCGCGDEDNVRVLTLDGPAPDHRHDHRHERDHSHPHAHDHDHEHGDHHDHEHGDHHDHEHGDNENSPEHGGLTPAEHANAHAPLTETMAIGEAILAKNDHLAQHNRDWLAQHGIVALNLMSSPGSGKTTLLERTITDLRQQCEIGVIEGDQETTFDADRIRQAGARAVQVNTGAGCHLDAAMVRRAIEALDPGPESLLFIENVGNLVCPALFDIGEEAKVVIISVTEGDDKPRKYPHMFAAADLVVVNKLDLLPYVDFDLSRFSRDARLLKPSVEILALSARTGENLTAWHRWILARRAVSAACLTKPAHP